MIIPTYQNLIKLPFFGTWVILSFDITFQCETMEEPITHSLQTFFNHSADTTDEQIDIFILSYATLYVFEYCKSITINE